MKLECSGSELAEVLSVVGRAVSPNNTLPVLNNILLEAGENNLSLSATNLEIAIHAECSARVSEPGRITIPAKTLVSYASFLKDEPVTLSLDGATLKIQSSGSQTEIKGIGAEEFPKLPTLSEPTSIEIPLEGLSRVLEEVVFSASTNVSRPVLTGVFFTIKGRSLKWVATDSYRLSERTLELSEDLPELNFIIPSRTVVELAKISSGTAEKKLKLDLSKNQIRFTVGSIQLSSRLIEGQFPDYEKILPKNVGTTAEVKADDFLLALRKVSVLVKDLNNHVRIKVDSGKLVVMSEENQLGKGTVELAVKSEGEVLETALNVQYLMDILGKLSGEVVDFSLNDGLSPVKVVPQKRSGFLHIIMPLKV